MRGRELTPKELRSRGWLVWAAVKLGADPANVFEHGNDVLSDWIQKKVKER